jgi:hypothetical protein
MGDERQVTSSSTGFVTRFGDKPVTAKKYHLYEDCGHCWLGSYDADDVKAERFDVDQRDIALLGLELCRTCRDRFKSQTASEVIAEALLRQYDDGDPRGPGSDRAFAESAAQEVITSLANAGFQIMSRKKSP